jgi:Mg2+/citrate symporter
MFLKILVAILTIAVIVIVIGAALLFNAYIASSIYQMLLQPIIKVALPLYFFMGLCLVWGVMIDSGLRTNLLTDIHKRLCNRDDLGIATNGNEVHKTFMNKAFFKDIFIIPLTAWGVAFIIHWVVGC